MEAKVFKNNLFKFLNENLGSIITISSFLISISIFFAKFYAYITNWAYFNYFGIDMIFYQSNNDNLIFEIGFSGILLMSFYVMCYKINDIYDALKSQNLKSELQAILVICAFNLFLTVGNILNGQDWLQSIQSITLPYLVTEIILAIILRKSIKKIKTEFYKDDEKLKDGFKKTIVSITYNLFIIVLIITCVGTINAINLKSYKVIEDDRVILYSTKEYYILSNCKINNGNLTIYTNEQKKIQANDIYTKTLIFKKVNKKLR